MWTIYSKEYSPSDLEVNNLHASNLQANDLHANKFN